MTTTVSHRKCSYSLLLFPYWKEINRKIYLFIHFECLSRQTIM